MREATTVQCSDLVTGVREVKKFHDVVTVTRGMRRGVQRWLISSAGPTPALYRILSIFGVL